jgi:hypothetical protein
MEKDSVKQFIRFLKEKDAYGAFINAFTSKAGKNTRIDWAYSEVRYGSNVYKSVPNDSFKSYYNVLVKPADLISWAFRWADTEGGDSFWGALDREWRKEAILNKY